ncbi:hypothetical protein SBOR_1193 [Sclerotinia borealis F-4128]|uniref:FAD-binding domain-containing protein n=1 Tax=Sclerotinia borealis (strain F-4128) TaxID=1432307 RepID=W9CNP9_SCLBF|nr:hypothetical protein SBOR_1193 [Sclerotinia borealis F-4128]
MSPDIKLLVIGAGTTGLLIAQGLKKAGIPFEIFEREISANATNRDRNWSMALHWGSQHLNSCLPDEILTKIRSIECDPYYQDEHGVMPPVSFKNAQSGEVLLDLPSDGMRRVNRRKMRSLFSEGLHIQYNKRLTSFTASDTTVMVTFEDGTSTSGTHLVGADGAKSLLRTNLIGDRAALTLLPYTFYNFKTNFTAEQARYLKDTSAFHPIMNFGINQELRTLAMVTILDVANRDKPETWTFQLSWSVFEKDPEYRARVTTMSNEEKLNFLQSNAELWMDPWKSALKWVLKGTEIPVDFCMLWKEPVQWNNHQGRVTLAGDAAHPMPPHRGQGLNNAIQDAANYIEAIKKIRNGTSSAVEAISAYDNEVFERGKKEINISAASAVATHDVESFKQGPLYKMGIQQPKAVDEVAVAALA